MENSMVSFKKDGYELRTTTIDGEPWFVAKDVAEVLGYGLATNMTRRLDEDEKGIRLSHTLGGEQNLTVINESGLYSAIIGSQKPEAKAFKKWVTSEVLPTIRKTGRYGIDQEVGRFYSFADMADEVGISVAEMTLFLIEAGVIWTTPGGYTLSPKYRHRSIVRAAYTKNTLGNTKEFIEFESRTKDFLLNFYRTVQSNRGVDTPSKRLN